MKCRLSSVILSLGITFLLGITLVVPAGCWGSPTFKLIVENQSEYNLTIYVNGYEMGNVNPGAQISDSGFSIDTGKYHIEAKNAEGQITFSKTLTFEQMQRVDNKRIWKAVIPPP
jgi:hypothetical protein